MTTSDNDAPRQQRQRPTRRDSDLHSGRLQPENMTAVINRLLLNPVTITFNGQQRVVTAVEAIVLQLLRKAMEGEAGARRVLLKYQGFARQSAKTRLEVRFLDSDYTQSLANWTEGQGE
jgi:uncharacterized protein DUF5681